MTLDFLLVTAAVDKVWRERCLFHWKLGTVTCVSREGLIELKKISGRLIDLADIEKLESGK